MTILNPRLSYKPWVYPWAYDNWVKQTRELYWHPNSILFDDDVADYKRLPEADKTFIRDIFAFFVQADADISGHYVRQYLPFFPVPEVRMMLLSFANMESTHIDAYSKLIEALGFTDYVGFLTYPAMSEKHRYFTGLEAPKTYEDLMLSIAVGSAFGEGLQLFGTFAMLLSYGARGMFKGMRDVVAWSLRDESLHVKGMIQIFHTLRAEYPQAWTDESKRAIYSAARDMVELEDRFISTVYHDGLSLPNLPKEVLHRYIRFLADHRLGQLGLKPEYYISTNPIEWMGMFTQELHEDLFNNTGTAYQHSTFDTGAIW